MFRKRKKYQAASTSLAQLWGFNLFLFAMFVTAYFGLPFLKTSVLEYQNIKSEPFDGTVSPIAYVPNWLDAKNWNKSLSFENVPTEEFLDIPRYDAELLSVSDQKNSMALFQRATYITPYMGSYRMNFEEYDGSHLWVDIRAPLGTPVLAIANGVVVRTSIRETADGKYVVVRHDDVPVSGTIATIYSSYLHLESVSVEPGTKIRKGSPVGKVGMTGITTTPHLHFQIDKASAPFHAYWPYSYSDLNELGIDFFAAVNMGLGKENALKHTVHPMEFVQANLTEWAAQVAVSSTTVAVASAAETSRAEVQSTPSQVPATKIEVSVPVQENSTPVLEVSESAPKNSAPEEPKKVELPAVKLPETSKPETDFATETFVAPFSDVPKNAPYRASFDRIDRSGALKPLESAYFRPNDVMTRKDAAMVFGALLGIRPVDFPELPFADVLPSDTSAGYLSVLVERGIVGSTKWFRPREAISRAEAAVLLTRASKIAEIHGKSLFADVSNDDTRVTALNAFSRSLRLKKNIRLAPNTPITRAEFIKMLDTWRERTGKLK